VKEGSGGAGKNLFHWLWGMDAPDDNMNGTYF